MGIMLNETRNILDRLRAADRVHQRENGGSFLLRGTKYVLALVLLAFILDVALHLSSGWRLGMLLGLAAVALFLAGASAYLAWMRRNRLEHIARLLESRDDSLGSKLINFLQLQTEVHDETLSPWTRTLAREAVEGYAGELRAAPLEKVAKTDELRRQLKRVTWAFLVFAAILAGFFKITAVEVVRFADPFGDHPPYSFTQLEIVEPGPEGTNVLYGRNVLIKVRSSGHRPKEVLITAHPPEHPDDRVTLEMFDKGRQGFDQQIENVRSELAVFAHTRDGHTVSRKIHVGVVLTPQLEEAFVQIKPPAYTGLREEEKPYAFKGLQTLVDSEIRFRLQSNRPLRGGRLEVLAGGKESQVVILQPVSAKEVSGSLVARESGRLRFSLEDVDGIPSGPAWEGALTVTHDLPPEIRITEPRSDSYVAMDFKVEGMIEADDDYGLSQIRVHRGLNGMYAAPKVVTYDTVVRTSREGVSFDIGTLGVEPGDVLSLFAEAVDTAPEPHIARSQTIHLLVISVEDYNNFLLEQTDLADLETKYDALMQDLQDWIERQKELGETADELKRSLEEADAQQREDLVRKLDQLLAKQGELNQQLNQHAEHLEHFVRDEPLYDVERDLQELLREQAARIRESTRTNQASATEIARQSAPDGAPRQLSPGMLAEFKQASDDQVARLGGVQEATERDVVDTLAEMGQMQELLKDFNLFEALYQVQQQVVEGVRPYNRPGELNREDQLALKDLAGAEKGVGERLGQLEQKLREDARAAEELFPKAAQSGRDLADAIRELRLQTLAHQATDAMLAAQGDQSFQVADRLRSEMEKLFSDCQGGNCPSGNELDQYLRLVRSMNPGRNFAQMARSRKFGPGNSQGFGLGMGMGAGGMSGYAVMSAAPLDVLGNETFGGDGSASARPSDRYGRARALSVTEAGSLSLDEAHALEGLNPVNRQSGAVIPESLIEEYNDVVDSYFKAITTRKEP